MGLSVAHKLIESHLVEGEIMPAGRALSLRSNCDSFAARLINDFRRREPEE